MEAYSVLKFGGSSMAQPEVAAEIFTSDQARNRVAVVSAIGKSTHGQTGDQKITDLLIGLEQAVDTSNVVVANELQEAVIERARDTYSTLESGRLNSICDRAYSLLQPAHRSSGYKWVGEHMSAQLFAALVDADYITSGLRFSGGVLQIAESSKAIHQSIAASLRQGKQIVTEGFFGYDIITGKVATLARGGSDISGIIYTGALNESTGDRYFNENYTDKDGILSADPAIVPEAVVISEITINEAREKMHGIQERNGVVHGDAIAYAAHLGVEMIVKNTFNPEVSGTRIVATRESEGQNPVIGISGKRAIRTMSVFDIGMADAKNYMTSILRKAGDNGMSVANVPTAEDRLKLTFNGGASDNNLASLKAFVEENAISGEYAQVETATDQGAIYIVGQELKKPLTYTKTIAKVASILADNGMSMKEVISHEQSPSLALTVNGPDVAEIIRLLHGKLISQSYD